MRVISGTINCVKILWLQEVGVQEGHKGIFIFLPLDAR